MTDFVHLPSDVVIILTRYLKPYVLYRLMQTSKHMFELASNDHAWNRITLHLVWRDLDCNQRHYGRAKRPDSLVHINHAMDDPPSEMWTAFGLHDMMFLTVSYARAMDIYECLVRDAVLFLKTLGNPLWVHWNADIPTLIAVGQALARSQTNIDDAALHLPPKQLARCFVEDIDSIEEAVLRNTDASTGKFCVPFGFVTAGDSLNTCVFFLSTCMHKYINYYPLHRST